MIDVLIAGIGGQGVQLASHMLCVLAAAKDWEASSFDASGMSEMGANVTSHVRIANKGENLYSPRIPRGGADIIMAFEPMEAARNLSYLSRAGRIITATGTIQPPKCAQELTNYSSGEVIEKLKDSLYAAIMHSMKSQGGRGAGKRSASDGKGPRYSKMYIVNEDRISEGLGDPKGLLATILLAEAIHTRSLPFERNDLAHTIDMCMRTAFREPNIAAMDKVLGYGGNDEGAEPDATGKFDMVGSGGPGSGGPGTGGFGHGEGGKSRAGVNVAGTVAGAVRSSTSEDRLGYSANDQMYMSAIDAPSTSSTKAQAYDASFDTGTGESTPHVMSAKVASGRRTRASLRRR